MLLPISLYGSHPHRLKNLQQQRAEQRKNYFVQIARKNLLETAPKQEPRKPLQINIPIKNVEEVKKEFGFIITYD